MSYRRGKRRPIEVWTIEGEFIGIYPSLTKAAERADVCVSSVSSVLSGKLGSANRYVFKESKG